MAFPAFQILMMSSKICNNASNEGLIKSLLLKKTLTLGKEKILKTKRMLTFLF